MWADRSFFQNTVNLVFGSLGDAVPPSCGTPWTAA
jgi:hypothetical protein